MTFIHKTDVLGTAETMGSAMGVLVTQKHVTPQKALPMIVGQETAKDVLLHVFGDRDTITLDEVRFGEEVDIDTRQALVTLLTNAAVASALRTEQARSVGERKIDVLARFPVVQKRNEFRAQLLRQCGLDTNPPSDADPRQS